MNARSKADVPGCGKSPVLMNVMHLHLGCTLAAPARPAGTQLPPACPLARAGLTRRNRRWRRRLHAPLGHFVPASLAAPLLVSLACQHHFFCHSRSHRQFPYLLSNYLSHDRLPILVQIILPPIQSARALARVTPSPRGASPGHAAVAFLPSSTFLPQPFFHYLPPLPS